MKNSKKKKVDFSKFFKKAVFSALVISFLFLPFHKSQAALWPGIDPNIKQMLENIQKRIEGIALSILKQEALKMLNRQIDKLIGGGGGGSSKSVAFITNWNTYLVKEPKDKTRVYMNDYLSQITRGRGSNGNYLSEGFSAGSILGILGGKGGGSYASQLVSMAKSQTSEKKEPQFNYPGDPSQMFKGGTFKLMSLYLSGINNPWGFSVNAQEKYQEKLAEEKKIAETKAVAYQGFKGTESKSKSAKSSDTTIKTPGSVVKDMVSNVKDIGNKIVAAAQHPEEIITAIVSQMMTKFIQQGIGEVEKVIDKETSKIQGLTNGASSAVNGFSGSSSGSQGGECQGRANGTRCGSNRTCQNGACK